MMVVIMGTIVSYISIIGLNSGTAIDLSVGTWMAQKLVLRFSVSQYHAPMVSESIWYATKSISDDSPVRK